MTVDFAKLLRDGPPPPPKVPGLVVGVTGHRPDKLCSAPGLRDGYNRRNPLREKVRARLREETAQLGPRQEKKYGIFFNK